MKPERGKRSGASRTADVITLSGAHFVHDVFTAFLPPLLPLLIDKLHLSLFQAGTLTALMQAPSLFNPILGWVTDRGGYSRAIVILAPGVSGAGLCLMGLAPDFAVTAVILLTTGISVAAIHVAGPSLVAEISGDRVGRGMGAFMVGGELARTAGPLIAVQAASWLTLEGMWMLTPVCAASSLVLWWRLSRLPAPEVKRRSDGPSAILRDIFRLWKRMRRIFLAVTGILLARAFMAAAAMTFLPTFMYSEGSSLWFSNIALAVLELAGAVGAYTSGSLSDLLGRRKVLLAATGLAPVMMLLFLVADGPFIFPALIGLGFTTLATTPVLMAAVMDGAGGDRAAATGTYMMMSFAFRSLIMMAVGALGDAIGLRPTYVICAMVAALGIPFALLLDSKKGEAI